MTSWIIHQNTDFCSSESGKKRPFREYLFNMVMGVVYIFCFVNLKEEKTRYKYCVYYVIMFLENCVCISLWYHCSDDTTWYHKPAIAWVFLSFIMGITCMLVYYTFLHPSGAATIIIKDSDTRVPLDRETLFSVCCRSSVTSHSIEDNSTPLEPANEQAKQSEIYVIKEDKEETEMPETGL